MYSCSCMSALLQRWLERTPGLEPDGFNFWAKYKWCVERYIDYEFKRPAEVPWSFSLLSYSHLNTSIYCIYTPCKECQVCSIAFCIIDSPGKKAVKIQ